MEVLDFKSPLQHSAVIQNMALRLPASTSMHQTHFGLVVAVADQHIAHQPNGHEADAAAKAANNCQPCPTLGVRAQR
jgi:hypothetical protein